MRKSKGIISILLSVVMVVSLIPMVAFAVNSEKLTVAPDTDVIINGGYVKGLDPADNTLASVKALFVNEAEKITAYNGDDALADSDRVGTGTVIKLSADKDSVIAILYGDVTGDGFITDEDYELIEKEAIGLEDAIADGSVYEKAADVNNDTVIDAFDLSLIDLQFSDSKDIDQRGDLPKAILNEINVNTVGENGTVVIDNESIAFDTAYELDATQSLDEIKGKEYKDWNVDIVIHFNKDVDGSKVYLAGQYGDYDWRGGKLSDSVITAGTKVSIINGWLGEHLTYTDVIDYVQSLKGAMHVEDAPEMLKVTCELVMTDTDTGDEYVVYAYDHIFNLSLPEAVIEDIDASAIGTDGDGMLTGAVTGDSVRADAGLRLSTEDTPADVIGKDYRFWTVDILVSFDRDVNGNDVYFFGDYGTYSWMGDKLAVVPAYNGTIAAGTEIALIGDWIPSVIGSEVLVTYDEIVNLVHSMETAVSVPNAEDGLKLTAKLVMTDPEAGDRYVVSTYEYTYPELPEAMIQPLLNKSFGTNGSLEYEGETVTADKVFRYLIKNRPASIDDKEYKDWNVDFLVSFNHDVDGSKVFLFGRYGDYDWTGGRLSNGTIEAGRRIALMKDWRGETVPFSLVYDLVSLDCAFDVVNPTPGLVVTIQLIMTNPATGARHIISTSKKTYN
ncbi:MAG: dockerin type I repeat-containing protein [Clostridia bacterium]|nr:dockerin type I repeat-containing protein [Clostridia bacterium]